MQDSSADAESRMGLTLIGEALLDAGLEKIEVYATFQQITVAQYTVTRQVFDIMLAEEWRHRLTELLQWR